MRPAWCWGKRGVRRPAAGSEEAGEAEAELAQAKAEAELSLAPLILRLVRLVRLAGPVVSGDALCCQRTLCQPIRQPIRQAQGHSLFVIKAKQPERLAEVTLLFDPPPPGECFATVTSRRTQRDRLEVRTLTASAALADYRHEWGWMGAQPVLRWESQVTSVGGTRKGPTTRLVRSFLTSLGRRVDPREVLRLGREHWQMENRLPSVRAVTMGEDASQVRSGAAPQVLAALRNAVLGLLRQHGYLTMAQALRHFAWSPGAALRFLGLHPTE